MNKKRCGILLLILVTIFNPCWSQRDSHSYLKGIAAEIEGKPDSAIYHFTVAINKDHAVPEFYLHRGRMHVKKNNYARAEQDFIKANELDKGSALLDLAKLHALQNSPGEATRYLKVYLSSKKKKPAGEIKLDKDFHQIEGTPEWTETWNSDWYTADELLLNEINFALKYGNYTEALYKSNDFIHRYPENPGGYHARAKAYGGIQNYRNALEDLNEAIKLKKDTGFYHTRANINLKLGRKEAALDDYYNMLYLAPENLPLYLKTSRLHADLGNHSRAGKDIKKYLTFFNNHKGLFIAGGIYYESGNYFQALKMFNILLKEDTSKASYFKARGKTYLKSRMYKYALKDLSMAMDLTPDDPEIYYYHAKARYLSGDEEGACKDWKKSFKLGMKEAMEEIVNHCDF